MNLDCTLFFFAVSVIGQGMTSHERFKRSCVLRKYTGIAYIADHINFDRTVHNPATLTDCINLCFEYAVCQAINYIENTRSCHLLNEGTFDVNHLDRNRVEKNLDSIHTVLDCGLKQPILPQSKPQLGSIQCGVQAPQLKPLLSSVKRIIGGSEAKPNSWPWLLHYSVELDDSMAYVCGANLIRVSDTVEASDIVITAAHCVTDHDDLYMVPRQPEKMTVKAGAHNIKYRTPYEERRNIAAFVIHPEYQIQGTLNDVAVLKLTRPIMFNDAIRPVCLPEKGAPIPVGQQCVAAGWGRIDPHKSGTSDVLMQLTLPAQPAEVCRYGWKQTYHEDKMICAGKLGSEATSSTCLGDSGGMLACRTSKYAPFTLYGLTSFGASSTCLSAEKPKIFARVSNYVDFITNTAKRLTELI